MQIQKIGSYNQNSNVNFKANFVNPEELGRVLTTPKSISDTDKTLSEICQGFENLSGNVKLTLLESNIDKKRIMANLLYDDGKAKQSIFRRIPADSQESDKVESLKGVFKDFLTNIQTKRR